jgi:hypothetical protein
MKELFFYEDGGEQMNRRKPRWSTYTDKEPLKVGRHGAEFEGMAVGTYRTQSYAADLREVAKRKLNN